MHNYALREYGNPPVPLPLAQEKIILQPQTIFTKENIPSFTHYFLST
jgi:hypothetical protein